MSDCFDVDIEKIMVAELKRDYPKHYVKMLRRKSPSVWKCIENYTSHLNDLSNPQKIFHWLNNIEEIPICVITQTPLKFWDLKFRYREYGKRGVLSTEATARRGKSKANNFNLATYQEKLENKKFNNLNSQESLTHLEASEQAKNLHKESKGDIGGMVVKMYNRYPLLHKYIASMDVEENEGMYQLVHDVAVAPMCPYTSIPLKFISYEQGYRDYDISARHEYRAEELLSRIEGAEIIKEKATMTEMLIKVMKNISDNMSLQNIKQSLAKENPSLVKSIIFHTQEMTTDKFSERVFYLLNGRPEWSRGVRFHSFQKGYIKNYENPSSSAGEQELISWLTSLNIEIQDHNRDLLGNRQEIDIYIPSVNLGIEYCGEYWHDFEKRGKNYHMFKTIEAEKHNIQLIQIFETEWYNKQEIIKSMLKSKLGLNDIRIFARKCEVRVIDTIEKCKFLKENHLQGDDKSKIKLGLYYRGELVSCMTFGRGYNQKEGSIEMVRFCNKINHQVIGGASKLLTFFLENYDHKEIHTYADRRFSNGKFYETIGFQKDGLTVPNYYYFKPCLPQYCKLEHRYNYAKHMLSNKLEKFDASLTEYDNMKLNGYRKIYDCGNLKFSYKR